MCNGTDMIAKIAHKSDSINGTLYATAALLLFFLPISVLTMYLNGNNAGDR